MNKIVEQYINHTLEHNNEPENVYQFCKKIKITEQDFYNQFANLQAIENLFWLELYNTTVEKLNKDKAFAKFTSVEKILTLYYAWVLELKNYRSFILFKYENKSINDIKLNALDDFKAIFISQLKTIIQKAEAENQIADRKFLNTKYPDAFWVQTLFILQFWIKDTSKSFEATDAAIEKSVQLAFSLMSNNAIDSAIDFGKFLFQQSRK